MSSGRGKGGKGLGKNAKKDRLYRVYQTNAEYPKPVAGHKKLFEATGYHRLGYALDAGYTELDIIRLIGARNFGAIGGDKDEVEKIVDEAKEAYEDYKRDGAFKKGGKIDEENDYYQPETARLANSYIRYQQQKGKMKKHVLLDYSEKLPAVLPRPDPREEERKVKAKQEDSYTNHFNINFDKKGPSQPKPAEKKASESKPKESNKKASSPKKKASQPKAKSPKKAPRKRAPPSKSSCDGRKDGNTYIVDGKKYKIKKRKDGSEFVTRRLTI